MLSTVVYSAELWPLRATLTKQLDTGEHRWQGTILPWACVRTRIELQRTEIEDWPGLVMWYGWTTSVYHSKHSTARFHNSWSTSSAADRLDMHSQERSTKIVTHLGRPKEAGAAAVNSQEWRPRGCGLNQGQGHDQICVNCFYSTVVLTVAYTFNLHLYRNQLWRLMRWRRLGLILATLLIVKQRDRCL